MKVMYSLIGLFLVIGVIYNVYMDKKEDIFVSQPQETIKEPVTQTNVNAITIRDEIDFTLIYEGQEAVDWLTNFLNDGINDDQVYQKLVDEDMKYLNASNSTFAVRKFLCAGICANGGWNNQSKEIMLFNERNQERISLFDLSDEQIVFTYLHETGHLILDRYTNGSEREEWIKIHDEVPAEELREYARSNYLEDFGDSYALYRLGVLHSEERLEFIKRLEKKAGVIK